jgi:D-glycero-D-manno-heptose 1,7-bisphosphate phosphatase
MVSGGRAAVFLDRDGVLNRAIVRNGKPYPPANLSEFEILPGVPDALVRLRGEQLPTLVVTNQPDVTTGKTTQAIVDQIHDRLRSTLALDAIYACYCVEGPGCDCYKPRPGLLIKAASEWGVDCTKSFMIGDRWRDVGAGKAAGCRTIFIDYDYAEQRPDAPDFVVQNLSQAVDIVLTAQLAIRPCAKLERGKPC